MYVLTASVIFIAIISIDLFTISFAYGTSGVKMPFKRVLVINIIGKVLIGGALVAGYFLGEIIPGIISIWLGFSILFALGLFKVVQYFLTRASDKPLKNISFKEALVLGFVLSIDGVAVSLGTIIGGMPFYFIYIVIGVMLVTDQLVFLLGNHLGLFLKRRQKVRTMNLNWLAGVILIIVAVVKLVLELVVFS